MGKIIFILGGARSGKSTYAVRIASSFKKKVAFIATGLALDKEMKNRIKIHQKNRPKNWQTFEKPYFDGDLLKKLIKDFEVIVIDCLTFFISNLMLKDLTDSDIEKRIKEILFLLKRHNGSSVIVSNEVGLGVVPESKLARRFRDLAGKINQLVGRFSDEIFFMVSGIPLKIKGKNGEDKKGN